MEYPVMQWEWSCSLERFWVRLPAGINPHHSVEVIAAVMIQMGWDLFPCLEADKDKVMPNVRWAFSTCSKLSRKGLYVGFLSRVFFSFVLCLELLATSNLCLSAWLGFPGEQGLEGASVWLFSPYQQYKVENFLSYSGKKVPFHSKLAQPK